MPAPKPRPVSDERLIALARAHGTPLFVYHAPTIRARVAELRASFECVRYAQKANASRAILELLRAEGCVVDAVSAGEAECALAAGFRPAEIVFTSDLFDHAGLACVARHRLPVNLGSADMLEQYAALGVGHEVTLRINPGFGSGHAPGVTTGGEQSKHGIWHAELDEVVGRARRLGLEVTGLHLHVGSGAPLEAHLTAARAMRALAPRVGHSLRVISAGGGLPIPYRPEETRIDLTRLANEWHAVRNALAQELDTELALEIEPGRYLVAESGMLVTEVRATKQNGPFAFALVDAGFHNLPRPLLYGAYHEISALGRAADEPRSPQVVAGPLCESSDVFTRDAAGHLKPRALPRLVPGDLLCLHDAGAYASSMASNYNGQPFAAEVLLEDSGQRVIRARQPVDELSR